MVIMCRRCWFCDGGFDGLYKLEKICLKVLTSEEIYVRIIKLSEMSGVH